MTILDTSCNWNINSVKIMMIIAGIGGSAFSGKRAEGLRPWVVGGCLASGLGLGALGLRRDDDAARVVDPARDR